MAFVRGTAPAPAQAPAQAPNRSAFSGIQSAIDRPPMLPEGCYRVKVISAVASTHPVKRTLTYKVTVQQVWRHEQGGVQPGDGQSYICLFGNTSPGVSDLKRLARACLGFAPTREERAQGSVTALDIEAERQYDAEQKAQYGDDGASMLSSFGMGCPTAPSIVGKEVDVRVSRGKETREGSGDYFRQYEWSAVG